MITEKNREAFLDLIIPPSEYKLTYCIGTTFTMELPCLIQLAINSNGVREKETTSFIQDFELITDFSNKACVFVQNCRIKCLDDEIPGKVKIMKLLDGIVHEVPSISKRGVFHPKVWLLRFDPIFGKDDPVFKLFVMSRNLTSSLKWDISVNAVGKLGKPGKINNELATFFGMLRDNSSIKKKRNTQIIAVLKDLQKIEFELPADRSIQKWDFAFKWGKVKSWTPISYTKYKKVIVVSPFLCEVELKKLNDQKNVTLVTTGRDLGKVDSFDYLKKNTFVSGSQDLDLHAKIYFGLHDDGTDVYAGSANCTNAGWTGDNVEAMCYLLTSRKAFDDFYSSFIKDGDGNLRPWLETFDNAFVGGTKTTEEEEQVKILDECQNSLSSGEFKIDYRDRDTVLIFEGDINLPKGLSGSIIILGSDESCELKDVINLSHKLGKIRLVDQTSFVKIQLKYKSLPTRIFYTVALCEINRTERNCTLIGNAMTNWDAFQEYLGFLLDFVRKPSEGLGKTLGGGGVSKGPITNSISEVAFLEKLLLRGACDPELIAKIDNALKSLEINSKKQKIEDLKKFKAIWTVFKQALLEFKDHG